VDTLEVNISQSGSWYIELEWLEPSLINTSGTVSPNNIIYIIEKTHTDTINDIHSQSLIAWVSRK